MAALPLYREWRKKYLFLHNGKQLYVHYNLKKDQDPADAITCSEAQGYGMMLAVLNNFQQDFDLLLVYLNNYTNSNGLMCWQQILPPGYASIVPTPDPPGAGMTSATDGDVDIAHSLLLASQKWPLQPDSRGMGIPAQYWTRSVPLLDAIWRNTVDATNLFFYLGDWVSPQDDKYSKVTRVSDFNLLAVYQFSQMDSKHNWGGLLDNLISILFQLFERVPSGSLFPDFAIRNASGKWEPVEGQILETEYDGCFSYNACRVPWRIAAYYKVTSDPRVEPIIQWIAKWAESKTPNGIFSGYTLDGQALNNYHSKAFLMPLWSCLHVLKKPSAERFYLDTMKLCTDSGYFEDAIANLCVAQCF